MTYGLGITTRHGLVLAADSRTNAGVDQINITRKLALLSRPGERVFAILSSGSLSCTQSVLTLITKEFDAGRGLATAPTMYDAARSAGEQIRRICDLDRPTLERDNLSFNVHLILAGQIAGQPHELYLVYPQGNPLRATEESPFLQIGETKYGRPILDRGIRYHETTLEQAAKYALISLDSTMRSNVSVGPPIDLLLYPTDSLDLTRHRRFTERDPDLAHIRTQWERSLRQAVHDLPAIDFPAAPPAKAPVGSELASPAVVVKAH